MVYFINAVEGLSFDLSCRQGNQFFDLTNINFCSFDERSNNTEQVS